MKGNGCSRGGDGSTSLKSWPSLDSVWLEGNPFHPASIEKMLTDQPSSMPNVKSLGLDLRQVDE
jgi:hypothetical protein